MPSQRAPGLATLTPLGFVVTALTLVWVLSGLVFQRPDIARAALDALLVTLWWSLPDWADWLRRSLRAAC